MVTDYATIFWLADVTIDESFRKKGLGKKLVGCIVNDPRLRGLAGVLATNDAHTLYEKYGFLRAPERCMLKPPNV